MMFEPERIDKLLRDLLDHTPEGGHAVTCFGDTGYDPKVDFPVCRRAVEELVSMGSDIVPQMLEVLDAKYEVPAFFAAEILGRLGAVEAADPLENIVRLQVCITLRMYYDQFTGYAVYEQAFDALLRMDRVRALGILQNIVETNASGVHWAKTKLVELNQRPM